MGWMAGLQLGASVLGSISSSGRARQSARAQEALIGEQTAIAKRLNGVATDQYDLYNEYSPEIYDSIFSQINEGPQYEKYEGIAAADVNQVFDGQEQRTQRNSLRMGIDPSSGRFGSQVRKNGLDRSLALVGEQNKARRNEDDKQWARLMTGADLSQSFMRNSNNASTAAMGGFKSAAGQQGQITSGFAKSSGQSAQAAGYFLNKLDDSGSGNNGVDAGLYAKGNNNGLKNSDGTAYRDDDNNFYK